MRRYAPWKRLYNATAYSLSGLFQAFRQEQAFEYEAVVFFFLCALLLHLRPPLPRALAVLGGWMAVMALELVNSAVEFGNQLCGGRFSCSGSSHKSG